MIEVRSDRRRSDAVSLGRGAPLCSHLPAAALKILFVAIGILIGTRPLPGQLPLVSADVLAGAGAHNRSAGETEFRGGVVPTARLTMTIRLGTSASTRPVVRVELEPRGPSDSSFGYGGPYSYPPTGGASYAIGVAHRSSPDVVFGGAIGGGRYGGEYRGSRHNSVFTEADVAAKMGEHASVVMNIQYRQWSADGARFWFAPLTIGVRFF